MFIVQSSGVHLDTRAGPGALGEHAEVPASRPPDDLDDEADAGPGERFSAALVDLLDVLAERGDRLGLDDDAVLGTVAQGIERWLAARWAQTPPQARPVLVLDAMRVALAARATTDPADDEDRGPDS